MAWRRGSRKTISGTGSPTRCHPGSMPMPVIRCPKAITAWPYKSPLNLPSRNGWDTDQFAGFLVKGVQSPFERSGNRCETMVCRHHQIPDNHCRESSWSSFQRFYSNTLLAELSFPRHLALWDLTRGGLDNTSPRTSHYTIPVRSPTYHKGRTRWALSFPRNGACSLNYP